MKNATNLVTLLLAIMGTTAAALADGLPQPQVVLPIFSQTELDPSDTYVAPSATEVLAIGNRLDLRSDFEMFRPDFFAVQKLTDRTYYVAINVYASTVYVGDHGVLVVDCGGHGGGFPGPAEALTLVQAIRTITPLPITHLVYSHPHTDHVGNSVFLKQIFPDLEIVASKWAAEQIRDFGYPIAEPTIEVKKRSGKFTFEGKKFRMVTPVTVGHTPADSYIVTPDRVLHVVDILHAGRLTFLEASVVQNLDGFIKILRHLAGEEGNYDYLNPGHLNVAYPRDVNRALVYYEALYRAWWESLQEFPLVTLIDPTQDNAAVWLRNFFDAIAESMFFKVAPEFGDVRFFELARDHASKVHENQFLHRLNSVDPSSIGLIPSFEPIAPRGVGNGGGGDDDDSDDDDSDDD